MIFFQTLSNLHFFIENRDHTAIVFPQCLSEKKGQCPAHCGLLLIQSSKLLAFSIFISFADPSPSISCALQIFLSVLGLKLIPQRARGKNDYPFKFFYIQSLKHSHFIHGQFSFFPLGLDKGSSIKDVIHFFTLCKIKPISFKNNAKPSNATKICTI